MKQLNCIIEYQFTEINCTETRIAFAQGQVVFQLEPGETYFLAPLYNGIAVTWPSISLAHFISKKSNREQGKTDFSAYYSSHFCHTSVMPWDGEDYQLSRLHVSQLHKRNSILFLDHLLYLKAYNT